MIQDCGTITWPSTAVLRKCSTSGQRSGPFSRRRSRRPGNPKEAEEVLLPRMLHSMWLTLTIAEQDGEEDAGPRTPKQRRVAKTPS